MERAKKACKKEMALQICILPIGVFQKSMLHFDENSQEEEKAYATFLFEHGTLFALKCSEKAQEIEICLRTCSFLE